MVHYMETAISPPNALLEPMVRLPSGRIVGAEVNDRGNLVPHDWGCDCDRCDPVAEAKRHRVREAAPDLLAALKEVEQLIEREDSGSGWHFKMACIGKDQAARVRAAIAKAGS